MLITVEKNKCEYLKGLSYYNHNLYEIPFQVDGCNIIQEIYDESWDSIFYNFGIIKDKKFISCFQVDSECNATMSRHFISFTVLIGI